MDDEAVVDHDDDYGARRSRRDSLSSADDSARSCDGVPEPYGDSRFEAEPTAPMLPQSREFSPSRSAESDNSLVPEEGGTRLSTIVRKGSKRQRRQSSPEAHRHDKTPHRVERRDAPRNSGRHHRSPRKSYVADATAGVRGSRYEPSDDDDSDDEEGEEEEKDAPGFSYIAVDIAREAELEAQSQEAGLEIAPLHISTSALKPEVAFDYYMRYLVAGVCVGGGGGGGV
jgi:hypothetical protein